MYVWYPHKAMIMLAPSFNFNQPIRMAATESAPPPHDTVYDEALPKQSDLDRGGREVYDERVTQRSEGLPSKILKKSV
jgi:hypothetical protein